MPEAADVSHLQVLLQRLQSEETPTRYAAIDELLALNKKELSAEQGHVLLLGAAKHFPPHKNNWTDIPAEIVSILMAQRSPEPSWAASAAKAYPSLRDRARRNVLALLGAIGDRAALTQYIDLLKAYGPPADSPRLAWPHVRRNPRHGDVVFPDLLAFASEPQTTKEVLVIALAFLEAGTFPGHATVRLNGLLTENWRWIAANAERSRNQPGGIWSDEYQELRTLAELVIDLCGRLASCETEWIIAEALNSSDRRLVSFAAIAAVRRGRSPPTAALRAAAEQPGPRHLLFSGLQDLRRTDLFPDQYFTQGALAEAEMCSWLRYPTELGREPDEIEQMAVIPLPDSTLDLYVFRFRTLGDHWAGSKGWLAGVAGPYRRSGRPGLPGGRRATFSRMEPWSLHDLQGHVETLLGDIEEITQLRGDPSRQEDPQGGRDVGSSDQVQWDRLAKAWQNIEYVQGMILDQADQGFTVDLGGVVAFLPASQVDIRPLRDVTSLKNAPQSFQILKMDRERGTIVVSRRVVLEAVRAERINQLKEGQVIEGVVDNIVDEGAFVDLGGSVIGLLSSSNIAWRRVNHPTEALSIGQQVKVKIIKIDPDGPRIWIGIKQLLHDPWEGIEAKFSVGDHFKGRVTDVREYGAFVELEGGVEGLLHVSDMSSSGNVLSPADLVSTGQEIDVQILEVDAVKRRISLKALEAEQPTK
jgi:predicted RNA-binding protein with RPS1 domain